MAAAKLTAKERKNLEALLARGEAMLPRLREMSAEAEKFLSEARAAEAKTKSV